MINLYNQRPTLPAKKIYFELACLYIGKGFSYFDNSIQYLNEALKEKSLEDSPQDDEIYLVLGNLRLEMLNESEAIRAYLNAAAVSTDNFSTIIEGVNDHLKSQSILSLKNWILDSWKPRVEKKLLDERGKKSLVFFWGKYNLFTKNYDEALKLYTKLLDTDSENFRLLEDLGEIYLQHNKFREAEYYLDRSYKFAPQEYSKNIFIKLIDSYIGSGEYVNAFDRIKNYKKRNEETSSILFLEAKVLRGIGEYESAVKILNKLIELESQKIDFHIERIENYFALHDYKAASNLIEKAFQIDSINNDLLFLKIENLIEGQIDIEGGKRLLTGDDYGFLKEEEHNITKDRINSILKLRNKDGNAYFFSAYIGNLLKIDKEIIKEWLNKAELLGLQIETSDIDPKTEIYLLKAEIANTNSDKKEAAQNFFEVAKVYYWATNYSKAEKYFTKTISLDPELYEAFIYQADALYMLCRQTAPPYFDEQHIEEAYKAWHKWGGNVATSIQAWYYITIARIHEARYKFRNDNANEEYWQAVLYGERALVHDPSSYSNWGHQGTFYRNLYLEQNSLFCLDKSLSIYKNDYYEDRIITLLNTGNHAEPLAYLEALKKGESTETEISYQTYHDLWKAYALYARKQFAHAAKLFGEVLEGDIENIWPRQMKMFCHWFQEEFKSAEKEASKILSLNKDYTYLKEEFAFAWASFLIGNVDEAIKILEEFDRKENSAADNGFSLCQFYLYTDQIQKAKVKFTKYVDYNFNKVNLNELSWGLPVLRSLLLRNRPNSTLLKSENVKIFEKWQLKISKRLDFLNTFQQTEINELDSIQAKNGFKKGTLPYIAIQAGLARLNRDINSRHYSYHIYKELIKIKKIDALFPEAKVALEQIENGVVKQGEDSLLHSKYDDAIAILEEFDLKATPKEWKKFLLLSFAYFAKDNAKKGLFYLQNLLKLATKVSDIQKNFWEYITSQLYSTKLSWGFGHFLKNNLNKLRSPEASIILDGMSENFWHVLMNKQNDALYPIVTPIAVEISNDLVPAEAYTDQWDVITTLIPKMRNRVIDEYGVKPASVRIRPNDYLTPDTYIVLLDDVPLVLGTVRSGKVCIAGRQDELAKHSITGERGWNPESGLNDCLWVDSQRKALLDQQGISYWNGPFDYIIAHLETVIVQNLDMYVDTQFCDDYLLKYINKTDEGATDADKVTEQVKRISENTQCFILFNQVLKTLVKEQVPILNKEVIITSFLKISRTYNEVNDIVQLLRIELRNELPVNRQKLEPIELTKDLEEIIKQHLMHEEGKTFLSMPIDVCVKTLEEIRDLMGNREQSTTVLLTQDSQRRIHLKKLTELAYSRLQVASQEEINKI